MKKNFVLVAAALACTSMFSSCAVGSFSALNWCFNFNNTLTPNKYVNAVVSWILSPFEFMIGGFADMIILNTVEFWTGSNPLQAATTVQGQNGHLYTISPDQNGGYVILDNTTEQQMALLFDKDSRTWTAEFDGMSTRVITLVDEQNAIVYTQSGEAMNITLDEAGLLACQNAVLGENVAMK